MAIEFETANGAVTEGAAGGNGAHPTNGRSKDLLEQAGFIAVKATFDVRQPLREVSQELVQRGVADQASRMGVVREIHRTRTELGLGRTGPVIKPRTE